MRRALAWLRARPSIGSALILAGAAVLFFSGRLEVGGMAVQLGMPGLQSTILPAIIALSGVLAAVHPAQHVFYGLVALAGSLYSLVAVNLGGYVVGMLLGCIGGVVVVSWLPRRAGVEAPEAA
jgi:hypothetical protein